MSRASPRPPLTASRHQPVSQAMPQNQKACHAPSNSVYSRLSSVDRPQGSLAQFDCLCSHRSDKPELESCRTAVLCGHVGRCEDVERAVWVLEPAYEMQK